MSSELSKNISYDLVGLNVSDSDVVIIWAHGWGHNKNSFAELANSLSQSATSVLVDLPGFGDSPEPADIWGSKEFADAMADFVGDIAANKKVIWVGHSFGGSVGVQMAANYPELIDGLALVASAGIRMHKSLRRRAYIWGRIRVFKTAKWVATRLGISHDRLYEKFGSADYKQAGSMRKILVKTINENLTEVASLISCPTILVYGSEDTATPPFVGKRYEETIAGSELSVLEGHDHYSLLKDGRHLVLKRIKTLIERI